MITTKSELKVGDRVKWESGSGAVLVGMIMRLVKTSGRMGDFVYNASDDDPRYIVETDDGKRAAHRADALSKVLGGI